MHPTYLQDDFLNLAQMVPGPMPCASAGYPGANCHVEFGGGAREDITLKDLRCQGEAIPGDGFDGYNCLWQAMELDHRGRKDYDFAEAAGYGAVVRSQRIYYAPDNQRAFCDQVDGETAAVLSGANNSDFHLSWVDDGEGRPALQFDFAVGMDINLEVPSMISLRTTRLGISARFSPRTCRPCDNDVCTRWEPIDRTFRDAEGRDFTVSQPGFWREELAPGATFACAEVLDRSSTVTVHGADTRT